jgi:hypothetical protein
MTQITQIDVPRIDVSLTTITFPEIALLVRDGHKLRGYFGHCSNVALQRCYNDVTIIMFSKTDTISIICRATGL